MKRPPNIQSDEIRIRGARTHNLKDVSVTIPIGSLTVITGVSGSGKSSLAFDTLYAEGQRRYAESLSTYARQFLERLDRVRDLDGFPLRRHGAEKARALELGESRALRAGATPPRGALRCSVPPGDRCHERRPPTVLGGAELLDRPVHAAGNGLVAAVRTRGRSPVGEEKPERVVNLRLRPDRRARVADAVLLFQGDRRRDRFDRVHVRPVEALQKLPGVRRERLRVAPLALGVERVEGQRGFPRARYAGDDRQPGERNLDRDVLEVVGPGSLDADRDGPWRKATLLQTTESTRPSPRFPRRILRAAGRAGSGRSRR